MHGEISAKPAGGSEFCSSCVWDSDLCANPYELTAFTLLLRPVLSYKLLMQGKEGTSGGPRGVWAWQLGNNPSVL